jgi:hypothetical protein
VVGGAGSGVVCVGVVVVVGVLAGGGVMGALAVGVVAAGVVAAGGCGVGLAGAGRCVDGARCRRWLPAEPCLVEWCVMGGLIVLEVVFGSAGRSKLGVPRLAMTVEAIRW